MVIQCKQCETTYNFDESTLHGGQIEVRCVRCKNVFTIDSTSTIPDQPIQPLLETEPATAFEPTTTLADLQPAPTPEPEPLPEWDAESDAFSFSSSEDFSFDDEESSLSALSSELAPSPEEPASQEFTFESLEPEPEVIAPPPLAPPVTEEPAMDEVKETPQPKAEKRKTSKFMIFLLLIILMIAGAYGYFFVTLGTTDVMKMIQNVQQQLQQLQQQPQVQSQDQQGEIRISTTQSYYVENSVSGQLFVIKGLATNDHITAQSELCVKGTLYQKKGTPLLHQTAYCGNIISDEELKSASMSSLNNQMANPFGAALSNVNVAPGQSLPFMIVFTDLPDELNEFSVEPSSSKASAN
ncbi:MAG: hypothetical protein BA874_03840 [Desulfuromonadales bacterium C00003068]|jgi:predicted Zn finger-like uncharacterized protein|nr:MAG: hypothetical protein BA874_03840 [Desulfuromonadales bacterium C00003068]